MQSMQARFFLKKIALESHTRTHEQNKKFACQECDKTFVQQSALKTHAATHSTERPFSCNICQKRFKIRQTLRSHMTSHDVPKLSCTFCEKKFTSSHLLKSHLRIHTGEKPYGCLLCTDCFSHQISLKTHMLKMHFHICRF